MCARQAGVGQHAGCPCRCSSAKPEQPSCKQLSRCLLNQDLCVVPLLTVTCVCEQAEREGGLVILPVHWAKPAVHVAALATLTHCRATTALADLTADHADHLAALRALPVLVNGHVSPSSELTRCSVNVILDQPGIRRISSLLLWHNPP
jgi:hypothetical protein